MEVTRIRDNLEARLSDVMEVRSIRLFKYEK